MSKLKELQKKAPQKKPSIFSGLKEKTAFLKWLDPFTYVDMLLNKVNKFHEKSWQHQAIDWAFYIVFGFIFAWLIYQGLGLLLQTTTPMVIVVSGSMEPVLYKGDVVVLLGAAGTNIHANQVEINADSLKGTILAEIAEVEYDNQKPVNIKFFNGKIIPIETKGDIIVYNSNLRVNFPIIHRVVAKIKAKDGYYFLTKGDNTSTNNLVDQDCKRTINNVPLCIHSTVVNENEIQGKQAFKIPFIGWIKLIIFGS